MARRPVAAESAHAAAWLLSPEFDGAAQPRGGLFSWGSLRLLLLLLLLLFLPALR
jgi:hypothetical protein